MDSEQGGKGALLTSASASAIVNNLSVRELIEIIEGNSMIAEACAHQALMMIECHQQRRRRGQKDSYNARYEVVVTGKQVSSGYHQHVYTTTIPGAPGAKT